MGGRVFVNFLIKDNDLKLRNLLQLNKEQDTKINTLKSEKQNLLNENHELRNKNNTLESNIDKLVNIIKNITGFVGTTLDSIFNEFNRNEHEDIDINGIGS